MKRTDLIIVACLALVFWPQLKGMVPLEPVAAPTAELQTLVSPVTDALDKTGGPIIAAFYRQFAEVVARDKTVLASTKQFREGHRRAARLMFKDSELAGKYPGVDGAISNAIAGHVGLDNAPIDEAKRMRIVEVLNAVSWAAGEAG